MRGALLMSCVTLSACTGLFTENGNAYPCDFSLPPAERDAPCVPGDVCSVKNVCTQFIYEGPRFEGPPQQPDYSLRDAGVVQPGALSGRVELLGRDLTSRGGVFVQTSNGVTARVSGRGQVFGAPTIPAGLSEAVLTTFPGVREALVGLSPVQRVSYAATKPNLMMVSDVTGPTATRLRAFPRVNDPELLTPAGRLTPPDFSAPAPAPPFRLLPEDAFDVPGTGLDVTVVNRQRLAPPMPVVISTEGLFAQQLDGGFAQLAGPTLLPTSATLSLNATSTLLAVNVGDTVLSTWQVGIEGGQHTLERAWPDCRPCGLAGISAVTPLPESAGVAVEVLCRGQNRSVVRVTGSAAVLPTDACVSQTVPAPFDLSRLSTRDTGVGGPALTMAATPRGAALGGTNGEVWVGETLSSMLPLGLDRVPLDVATVTTTIAGQQNAALIALTDRYAAVLPPRIPDNQLASGFRRIDPALDLNATETVQFNAAIHGANGWALSSAGVVIQVLLDEDDATAGSGLRFGKRLVSPTGQPVQRSAGGEAFVDRNDGGVMALFIAADDGLYAINQPESSLTADAVNGSGDVTPQLQPEPSVPIRSLALERTGLGTNGTTRASGYLVTSRNVYEWMLGGTPARWSSRLLELSGGEPVEVWFDQSGSALGRVGYADGTIFTLPGGYQLANPLPPGTDDTPARVVDYENYGGWPVALTTTGLFAARWPEEDGVVKNRFPDGRPNRPMDWTELALPDGSKPWAKGEATRGKLFVQAFPRDVNNRRRFRLYLFLPDQVLLLADYERK